MIVKLNQGLIKKIRAASDIDQRGHFFLKKECYKFALDADSSSGIKTNFISLFNICLADRDVVNACFCKLKRLVFGSFFFKNTIL